MEPYVVYHFDEKSENFLAELIALGFESFEELEEGLDAYMETQVDSSFIDQEVDYLCKRYKTSWQKRIISHQNWNAIWESNFQPVGVENFCYVRAHFHEPKNGYAYDIVITPKMAFGTGHHATTYMMIDAMAHIDFKQKHVFDYGSGTGILGILAAKLQASHILCLDNEKEAFLNIKENAAINEVNAYIDAEYGTLQSLPSAQNFDIILANINRNVLQESVDTLSKWQNSGQVLLLSGILSHESRMVSEMYQAKGYIEDSIKEKDGWHCIVLHKL